MKRVTLGAGEMPVVIDRMLPPDWVVRIDGQIHVGSMAAVERLVAEMGRWVVLRTVPPTLMHRETGELVALEGEADHPPRCERCGVRHG